MAIGGIVVWIVIIVIVLLIVKNGQAKAKTQSTTTNKEFETVNNDGMQRKKYCSYCGAEIHEKAVVCVKCGCAVAPNPVYENDVPSTGLNVLGFLFPLIGLILFLVYKDRTPIKAKMIGKWALIGFVVWLLLYIVSTIAMFA